MKQQIAKPERSLRLNIKETNLVWLMLRATIERTTIQLTVEQSNEILKLYQKLSLNRKEG